MTKDSFTIDVMTSSTHYFRAQTIPTIIMVIITPMLCGLGLWQLDRAAQKRQQASALEMQRNLPPLSLNDEQLPQRDSMLYRHVVAKGHFLNDKAIYIENRKHLGKTGFHIITPLQLSGNGRIVLVNRGWVAHDQLDEKLNLPLNSIQQIVDGEVTIPEAPAIELTPSNQQSQSPPQWPYLTLPRYIEWSGLEVLPMMILQTSKDDLAFIRQWPTPKVSDLMHIGYAIQWFAFAIIALLVWLRLSLQKTEESEV
ncbi:MAG: SURF1 family protein [Candidatus Thiodiazotropha sp. 6PLUC4]